MDLTRLPFRFPESPGAWKRVLWAAAWTTIGAMIVAQSLLLMMIEQMTFQEGLRVAPKIVVITAFPISAFVWSQVYLNQELTEELQRLVDRDRLTDVGTRDFFFSRMAQNPGSYGVSLMIDIDHFKTINDTHGHLAGDAVIREVAQLLRANVRPGDIVARFGGEEFLVFLEGTSPDAAYQLAERMRKAIAEHRVAFEALHVGVTVSIGGSLKEARADIETAIRDADAALYRAKRAGRNQTIFAENAPQMAAS